MELNQCGQYRVTFDESNLTYSFITKNGIPYDVFFVDSSELFKGTSVENDLGIVCSLTIQKNTDVREPFDPEVRKTIDSILQHYFSDCKKSLLYVCDTLDKKEHKRYLKFNKWFLESRYKESVGKMDEFITDEDGMTYYSTLIFHHNNPYKTNLVKALFEFSDSLRNK
jgi:hypothetical protein